MDMRIELIEIYGRLTDTTEFAAKKYLEDYLIIRGWN